VLNDADPISTWNDSSGNGFTVTQATGGLQPIYKISILNGYPVVRFDGSNDALVNAPFALSQPFTVITVVKGGASGSFQDFMFGGGAASLTINTSGNLAVYGGNLVSGTSDIRGGNHVCTGIFNTVSSACLVDGIQQGSGDCGTGNYSGITIGNNSSGTSGLNGDLAEGLIYDSALSSTNRGNVEAYLKAKYGL
jgi:hypothetical protein